MERRFCGKCGRPISDCICADKQAATAPAQVRTTDFAAVRSQQERTNAAGSFYVERFDNLALAQGEVVVRQYHIGKFASALGLAGKGNSSILVTNMRVISKSDTTYMLTSSNMVEEIALKDVSGVKTYYAQGITKWRLMVGICAAIMALICLIMAFAAEFGMIVGFLLAGGVATWMFLTMRKPSYLFSIYSGAMSQAMTMGANLRGKLMNAAGGGIIFQYKATKEAVKMMREMGACIMDLKTRGNAAIDFWKKMD